MLGLWSTCYAFGGLVASPFAGWWAYSVFGTWHAAFYSSAAVVGGVALLFLLLQRNRPEDVGHPPVEPQAASEAVRYAGFRPEGGNGGSLQVLAKVVRNRTVLCLGLAYFLLKPARYAILLWGPVIVYERMPALGKVGAAIVPTAFEVAGLLGPILIGFASDKLFGARRMPACVISLLALTVCLALFVPAMTTGSIPIVVGLLFMMGLTLYGPDSMICGSAAIDFGTSEAAGTASGFVNGCGSVGAILGGLLPGYFDTYTVFIGFHHRSPDRHRGAPPALEQPARRRTGKPAEYPQPGGLPSHPLLTVRGGNLRRVLLHEPGTPSCISNVSKSSSVGPRWPCTATRSTSAARSQTTPAVTSRTRPARSWRTSTGCSRASAATAARCSRYAYC
ncbi:sugar MFS transporter [Pseudomonas aeruginosa]|nr:sugar MFS transporter [Pseudomonas aeruginosa]